MYLLFIVHFITKNAQGNDSLKVSKQKAWINYFHKHKHASGLNSHEKDALFEWNESTTFPMFVSRLSLPIIQHLLSLHSLSDHLSARPDALCGSSSLAIWTKALWPLGASTCTLPLLHILLPSCWESNQNNKKIKSNEKFNKYIIWLVWIIDESVSHQFSQIKSIGL